MRIVIGRHPEAVTFIREHLKPDKDYSSEEFAYMLKGMMENTPDDLFLPIVIDGESAVAFVAAVSPPDQAHTWILQAWTSEKLTDDRIKDTLFIEVIMWTLSQGRRKIRAEVGRDTADCLTRWGFEPFSQVLDYQVEEDFEERLLARTQRAGARRKEDDSNGSLRLHAQRTGDGDTPNADTGTTRSIGRRAPRNSTRVAKGSVPRASDGSDEPGDARPSKISGGAG